MTSPLSQDGATSSEEALFNARLKAIFEEVLAANAPALVDAASRKALDFSRAEIEKRVQDAKAEVDAYRSSSPASDGRPQPPSPANAPLSIAETIRTIIDSVPNLISQSLDSYDKLVTIRMKQANIGMQMMERAKINPDEVSFYAQRFVPEPLQNKMSELLAKNSLDTANAVVRTLMRQGAVPRGGRLAIDPFGEDSETQDGPDNGYDIPMPESRPRSVEMHRRARGARPTTLREALA